MHLALTPDQTAFVQWGIFIACFLVLHWGIFKPTLKILEARKSKTSDLRHRADSLRHEAEEMTAKCEARVAEARQAGLKKRTAKIQLGSQYREEQMKKVRTEIDHQMETVRAKIETSSQEAHAKLRQSIQELGSDVASKILGREVTS